MDAFMNDTTLKVMAMSEKYVDWIRKNKQEWIEKIDRLILRASNGKIRVFQTFFESPTEAFSGSCVFQALSEYDLRTMYPKLVEITESIANNDYMYIFTCNNSPNKALIAYTII